MMDDVPVCKGEIVTLEEEEAALLKAIEWRENNYGFSEINAVIDVLEQIHKGDIVTPYLRMT